MDEPNKNIIKLVDDLKNLPRVNAPVNFEDKVWEKISATETKNESFWKNIFSQKRIVPAAVAIASAVIIFFIIDIKSTQVEDPLNMQPRMREDVILVKDYDDIETFQEKSESKENQKKDLNKTKPENELRSKESETNLKLGKEKSSISENSIIDETKPESLMRKQSEIIGGAVQPEVSAVPEIKKDNFNFMQIKLSDKQKKEVEQLKQRLQSTESAKSVQK